MRSGYLISLAGGAAAIPVGFTLPAFSLPFKAPTPSATSLPKLPEFPAAGLPSDIPSGFPKLPEFPAAGVPSAVPTGFPELPAAGFPSDIPKVSLPDLKPRQIPGLNLPSAGLPNVALPTGIPVGLPTGLPYSLPKLPLRRRQIPDFKLPFSGLPSAAFPTALPTALPTGIPVPSLGAFPANLPKLPFGRRQPFTLPGLGDLFKLPGLGGSSSTKTSSTAAAKPTSSKSSVVAAPETSTSAAPTTPTTTTSAAAPPASSPTGNCTPQGNGGGSTESGVLNNNCCTDLTVIFARGTTESGNVGTIAGPPLFKALRSKLGASRVTVQGVDYPADAAGNANQGASGGPTLAADVKQALAQCPKTKIVVSGYSQGGMVVHNAFSAQGLTASQVSAAVLYGDPFNGQAVGNLPASSVKQFCASGDQVCDGSGTFAITAAHTTYGNNADEAASFIISTLGL